LFRIGSLDAQKADDASIAESRPWPLSMLAAVAMPASFLSGLIAQNERQHCRRIYSPRLLTIGQKIETPGQPSQVFMPSIAPVNFDEIV
jgi:hypothetical protein